MDPRSFRDRLRSLFAAMSPCRLCPRSCGAQMMVDERRSCRAGVKPVVASYGPHPGEEDVLRGHLGSGTIFFSGCNLKCVFCQNADISHFRHGRAVTPLALSRIMLRLESVGCHNINLVSPTHAVAPIFCAVYLAAREGLRIPLVYNTGGYDSVEILRLVDGLVDIYMPDMKFASPKTAGRLAGAPDYPEANRRAVAEMHRQVGQLQVGTGGLATRGLLVRHLVLPGLLDETREILEFLAEELGPGTAVNVMGQYYPHHHARRFPPLDRPLRRKELKTAREWAREMGLWLID